MPLPLLPIFAALGAGTLGTAAAIGADRRSRGTAKKMEDPLGYDESEKGAFMSVLEYLGRPAKVLNNVAMGNFEGASRQVLDIAGDTVDAVIPGVDLIPQFSRRMDSPSFSAVAGGMDDGIAKTLVDIGGGILTDPLTYTGLGPVAKLAKAGYGGAKTAFSALPNGAEAVGKFEEGAQALGRGVRSTFGAQRISPETRALVDQGAAAGSLTAQAQTKAMNEALKGLSEAERKTAFRVINNYTRDSAGKAVPILEDSVPLAATADDVARGGLVGIAPDAGQMVQPLRAGDAYFQVKAPGKSRGPIDPMDAGLGIKGVDVPGLTPNLTETVLDPMRIFENTFNPARANAAALRTLDIAYPKFATEGRFASGIDLANKATIGAAADAPSAMRASKGLGPIPKAPKPEGMDAPGLDYLTGRGAPAAAKAAEKPAAATFDTIEGHMARFSQRLAAMGIEGAERAKMEDFFSKWLPQTQGQYREAIEKGAFSRVPGVDIQREMPIDYVQRKFTGMLDESGDLVEGSAQAGKARTLRTGEKLIEFLNDPKNAGVTLEEDIAKAGLSRAEQQGRMVQSATIGKQLIDKTADAARDKQMLQKALTPAEEAALDVRYKAFNEPGVGAAVKNILDEMKAVAPEDAQVLRNAVFGLAPRGAVSDFLAKTLKPFKAAAVYGYIIPKIGNNVRNRVSGIWQTASNPEARGAVGGMTKRLGSDLAGAVSDSMNLRIGKDKFSRILGDWDDALRNSRGSADAALATMAAKHPGAVTEVLRRGILDGFTSSEQMITEMGKSGWKKKYANIADWPARIFKGIEDRMRIGLALDLVEGGKSADEAVRIASDTLYKYDVSSVANREARTVIPFFQFVAKAIPQQAKFMAEKPAVLSGIRNAMEMNADGPIYPMMEGKLNIGIGEDEKGDAQYLSGLGLPFEALNAIPNLSGGFRDFGRDVERSIVGSANPVLKTAYSVVSGREPYFGSDYASYGKLPGNVEAGAIGRGYNALVGTGLVQPLASLGQVAGNLIDDRKSPIEKTLALLSPAKIQSVDEDRALQAQIRATLERNPNIKQFMTPYAVDGDAEGQRLVEELKQVGKRIRDRRAAEAGGR